MQGSLLPVGTGGQYQETARPWALPSRSREKMRCADFRVFSLRVQGPQPLPQEVRNPGGFRIQLSSPLCGGAPPGLAAISSLCNSHHVTNALLTRVLRREVHSRQEV